MMLLLICVLVFVFLLTVGWFCFDRTPVTQVEGVRVTVADQKRFAGFYVAIDTAVDEVIVVGRDYWSVRQEVAHHGLLHQVVIVTLPGEQNEILAALVDPKPITRRYDNASVN